MDLKYIEKSLAAGVVLAIATFVVRKSYGFAADAELWAHSIGIGATVFIGGLIGGGIRCLFKSPNEGARRIRSILKITVALFVLALIAHDSGVGGVLAALGIVGAVYWVYRGFTKDRFKGHSSAPIEGSDAEPAGRRGATENAPEFNGINDTAHIRKTVITCPNCDERLRVLAGKYIDVTCPHCRTVFRTHT